MFDFLAALGGIFYEPDHPHRAPMWMESEIRTHDQTGCPGREFRSGKFGGLVCTTCGK